MTQEISNEYKPKLKIGIYLQLQTPGDAVKGSKSINVPHFIKFLCSLRTATL